MHKTKIIISSESLWFWCIAFLLLPSKLVIAWIVSVVIHESFHYLALKAFNCDVYTVKAGVFGAQMETQPLSKREEIICAAAGPLGGLLLTVFIRSFPLLSVMGVLHSIYNLIPIYPLDGGRIAHCLISRFSKKPDRIERWFDRVVLLLLFAISLYAFLKLSSGIIPFLLVFSLAVKSNKKIFLQT